MKNNEANNIDLWEKVLNELPESYRSWFKDERKFLHKYITKHSKVLEVGCGDGRSIKDIIDITQEVTCIDNEQKAVNDAKLNFKYYSKVKILLAEAIDLPLENNSFDFVLCLTTFANFGNDKYKALEEMKRVLKDEGSIIISVFSEKALEERMKIYKKLKCVIKEASKNGRVIIETNSGVIVSEQFSKKELIEIFNKTNLKVDEIIKSGIGYICKLSKN
ncbi:MAG: class I SAM-dependent methyltransferase [Nanoarchaeota archaeon]